MELRLDCRHFRGEKPCARGCSCEGCAHYAPMGARILIIKLDAIGDVARTTTLLRPLRAAHDPCHITWLVHPGGAEMLRGNSQIDVLLPYVAEGLEPLRVQEFDLVLSLDKTPRATAVAEWVKGKEKLGFGLSPYGTVYPINAEAIYAFQLGLDDDLKFRRNTKTYQEIIFECVRLPYRGEEYCVEIAAGDRAEAAAALAERGIGEGDTVIGLNLGGGAAFAHKMWDGPEAVAFLRALKGALACKALLFGAEREAEKLAAILAAGLPDVFEAATPRSVRVFQALLGRCDAVVTGDSLGLHLALAERRPVVALFGPTCAAEIELYGRGETLVSPVDCAPCYRARCERSPSCMQAIEPAAVVEAVKRQLERARGES